MRRIIPAGAAALVVATGGAGVAIAAQAKTPERPATVFQTQLAQRLGVSPEKLRDAAEAAGKDTIEQLKADGRLSADRAARLEQRLERKGTTGLELFGGPRRANAVRTATLDAEASALGLDRTALMTELRKGTAPATLIAGRGKDPATVADAVRSAARTALQPAVDAGRLTADAADGRAAKVAERLTGKQPLGRHRGRG
jgi:hypothetical protein